MPKLFEVASRRTVLGGIVSATGAATLGAAAMASGMSKAVAPSPEFLACEDLWAVLEQPLDDDAAVDAAVEEYLTAIDRLAALPHSTGKLFELNQLARMQAKGPVQRKHLLDFDYITFAIYQCLDALAGEAV